MSRGARKKPVNRFDAFTPEERIILRVLLQNHANSVSEIAITRNKRVSDYLILIEDLEREVSECQ